MPHLPRTGWIEVIVGSMYSGKTEELIRRLRRAQIARQRVEIFKPAIDQRYAPDAIVSHSELRIPSRAVSQAKEILRHAHEADVIGIDEVSRRKGQRYVTIVYDLSRGRVVWVGRDRDAATMKRFFTWLGPRRARAIHTVCCDMWSVYIDAVETHLPQAALVFDRFHLSQHLSRAVDEVRRQTFIRTLKLISAGTGQCPSCGREAERFVKRPPSSKDSKPRCLGCWKAEC